MDYTKKMACLSCGTEMRGAGGNFGGRIETATKKCPNCNLAVL